jgi:hypothetical protein
VLDCTFCGTGTLVEIDGVKGILTAEHVVHNPEGKTFDNSDDSQQSLDIPATMFGEEFPENLPTPETAKFRVRELTWYPKFRNDKTFGEWGPDLVFIRLGEILPQVGSLKAKKSFWILDRDIEKRTNIVRNRHDFFGFVGAPNEWTRLGKLAVDGSAVKKLTSGAFFGPDYVYHPNSGGFDFVDLRFATTPLDKLPDRFGGVSGGGLWFIQIEKDVQPPLFPSYNFWLIGVAFFQIERSGEPSAIRSHGPRSLYETFVSKLRQDFMQS